MNAPIEILLFARGPYVNRKYEAAESVLDLLRGPESGLAAE